MNLQPAPADDLLTPAEVAAILFVDPKTVTRWARAGKLDSIRTPGGHRRYLRTDVLAIMSGAHHSQRPDARPITPMGTTPPGPRPEVDGDVAAAAVVSEAVAVALETEAWEAAQAVVVSAAAVAAAAEKAAAAASRARAARRLATEQAALTTAGQAVRSAAGNTSGAAESEANAAPVAAAAVAATAYAADLELESGVTTAANALLDLTTATGRHVAAAAVQVPEQRQHDTPTA